MLIPNTFHQYQVDQTSSQRRTKTYLTLDAPTVAILKRIVTVLGVIFIATKDHSYTNVTTVGQGRTLSNFLKDQDPDLYGEYVMEAYREGNTGKGTKIPLPDLKFEKPSF